MVKPRAVSWPNCKIAPSPSLKPQTPPRPAYPNAVAEQLAALRDALDTLAPGRFLVTLGCQLQKFLDTLHPTCSILCVLQSNVNSVQASEHCSLSSTV